MSIEITKIIGIGLTALIIIIILKQYRPEFALYTSIIAGIFILVLSLNNISGVIGMLKDLSSKANINSNFLGIILKITGIAILTEFAISICQDSGESSIANKIDIGGKVIIITISLPIISTLLETILKILP